MCVKKIILTVMLVFILFFSSVSAINTEKQVISVKNIIQHSYEEDFIEMINQINESMVRKYLDGQVAFGPRPTGSENCSKTADYLYSEFKKMGLDVEFQPFSFIRNKGKNVVATLNGTDSSSDAVFIICCHYDTWPGSPGANDDASGCAAVLAIANVMSRSAFNHTVRFILFSGHEQGAYGSSAYARKAYENGDNIQGVICLGSIGRISNSENIFQICRSYRSDWIYELTKETCEKYGFLNLTVEPVPMMYADNLPFERYGFTSTFAGSGPDDVKDHCPEDDLDLINYSYLARITQIMFIVSVKLASDPIDLQVRFISPKEGYIYFTNNLKMRHPLTKTLFIDLQGITYLIGNRITADIDIKSNEEISYVIYSVDKEFNYVNYVREPPYSWKIRLHSYGHYLFKGRHTIEVTVMTVSGKTAYDEMDVFIV